MFGAYSLIEHCRGWPALYYLFQRGKLTGAGDLPLPFAPKDLADNECPGGIISFYLAGPCGPLELYLLLNVILHRQMGNSLSFLSTLAPVAIYQKMLATVCECIQLKPNPGYIALLVMLMRDVVNALNRGYVLRVGTACREVEKILGSPGSEKGRKKSAMPIDFLVSASRCVEKSLE